MSSLSSEAPAYRYNADGNGESYPYVMHSLWPVHISSLFFTVARKKVTEMEMSSITKISGQAIDRIAMFWAVRKIGLTPSFLQIG
jgi:hypothetical protein